ncbi:3-BPG phosphatase) (Band 17) (Histidine phosphatase of the endoplasmic reticulum 1) (HiPER1), partial [Durusdinium trenchii]
TPYAERPRDLDHLEPETCEHLPGACELVHMYKVVRHGTRFPTAKHMRKMAQVARLFGRELAFRERDAGLLTAAGDAELVEMGERTRERFPELFDEAYHPAVFDFRSSQVTRALQSAAAFARGIFPNASVAIVSETKALDTLLRFHKACPRYARQVKKNETLAASGPVAAARREFYPRVFASILQTVRAKGLHDAAELLEEIQKGGGVGDGDGTDEMEKVVANVWDICMMEHASLNRESWFCALLSPADMDLLEFLDDVASYWIKGYGFPINYEMSCLLFRDMVDTSRRALHEVVAGSDEHVGRSKASLRFGHAETVIPLLARLGLFKPEAEPKLEDQRRRWHTGTLVPFAANVAMVVSLCDSEERLESSPRKAAVQIFHNEHPVRLPDDLCPAAARLSPTMCSFEAFVDQVAHIATECHLDSICE